MQRRSPAGGTEASSRRLFVRSVSAGDMLEIFLVAGITSLLAIRFYLQATGFPQVGGDGLHIAHMLWGGLAMLIALVLLLGFLGQRIKTIAALLGGAGFGIFIDELGKFITSDNNYFFRPAIALIYVIFVVLFLVFRTMNRRAELTEQECLANVLDVVKESVLHDLHVDERAQAIQLLDRVPPTHPFVPLLRAALAGVKPEMLRSPSRVRRGAGWLRDRYQRLAESRWFVRLLIAAFVVGGVIDVLSLGEVVVTDERFTVTAPHLSFVDWIQTGSAAVAGALGLLGVLRLRYSRVDAFTWFRRAVLVSIFVTEPFIFYGEQLTALANLAVDVLTLVAVNYMLAREQDREADTTLSMAAVPAPA